MAKKKYTLAKCLVGILVGCNLLALLYFTAVYSKIPFIEKWRNIYIETAMSTNSHQWLATWFIPSSIIQEVLDEKQMNIDAQKELTSAWEDESVNRSELSFYELYWELDSESVRAYLTDAAAFETSGIKIDDMEGQLGLKTIFDDPLLALDTANNIMIIGVSGDNYVGKLAIVKDPSKVQMVKSDYLGSSGQEAITYAEKYDAALVVNASAFRDVGGHGSGGEVRGSLVIDGTEYGKPEKGFWKTIGFQQDYRLYISNYEDIDVTQYRWTTEFYPALIIDGEDVVDGTYGMGIQPRTAIGQTKTGDFLALVIDGRQVGYSLGSTVQDCCDILKKYGAYQAANLDGGSSSVMIYQGEQITRSSSATGKGRYMPSALIVNKNSG